MIKYLIPAFTLPTALEDVLSLVVGGGTSEEILIKSVLWVLVFAVLFNKGTTKIFHGNRVIPVIIALILSTLAMYFAPESIISWIVAWAGFILPVSIIFIVYWALWWAIKSKRLRRLMIAVFLAVVVWWLNAKVYSLPVLYYYLQAHDNQLIILNFIFIIASIGFFIASLKRSPEQVDREVGRGQLRAEAARDLAEIAEIRRRRRVHR